MKEGGGDIRGIEDVGADAVAGCAGQSLGVQSVEGQHIGSFIRAGLLRGISARRGCISLEIWPREATEASLRLHAGRSHLSLAGVACEHAEALSS